MELHEYQKKIKDFCLTHRNALLSVDMGLGKTISVLTFINELQPKSCLIIAPKRVAETIWKQEAEKWELHNIADKMVIVKGVPSKRKQMLNDKTKPYKIVSRDRLKEVTHTFDCVIIDELTSFKTMNTARSKEVQRIVANAWNVVGLTGTFLANGAIDIFGQCKAVGLNLCDGNFWCWRALNFKDILAGSGLQYSKWKPIKSVEEMIKDVRNNIFTLSADDYLHIPQVTHVTHSLEMSDKERNAYDSTDAFLSFELSEDETMSIKERAKFCKLQTLCNGFVYNEEGGAVRLTHSTKLEAVAEFCERCKGEGESVLLFYAYVEEAKWLYELLKERGLTITNAKQDGFLEKWNNGEIDVLMAHPASAGHGLNLQHGGRIVVWSSLTYNYEYYAQANARLARQGQTKPVQIHYFTMRDTIEEKQRKALEEKAKTQGEFISLTKQ